MKAASLCFVLLWYIVQVFSAEFPDELLDNAGHECLKENNVDEKELSKYFDDKLRMVNLDEVGIKLVKCSIEKKNYYNSDGAFNKEVMTKDIAKWLELVFKKKGADYEELVEKLYQKCEKIKGDNQVEQMIEWNNCLVDEHEKMNN